MSKRYQCDLTDQQWLIIKPLLPVEKDGGRPRTTDMREVMNAIFYLLRTGYQWEYLPKCFPPKSTVCDYFTQWRDDGVLEDMMRVLREEIRASSGRNPKTSAGIIDSQTVKTAGPAMNIGYDGGKKKKEESVILWLMFWVYSWLSWFIRLGFKTVLVHVF